jgi:hypothetical protein
MALMWLVAGYWLALHLLIAGPLRTSIVGKMGENAFQGLFSLLSVAGIVGYIFAARAATLGAVGFCSRVPGFSFRCVRHGDREPDRHACAGADRH